MKYVLFTASMSLLLLFTSCKNKAQNTASPHIDNVYSRELESATVIFYELDGCKWMLQLANGQKLQPTELDEEFLINNLKVKIAYDRIPDAPNICMAGQVVKLIRIIKAE